MLTRVTVSVVILVVAPATLMLEGNGLAGEASLIVMGAGLVKVWAPTLMEKIENNTM
jgi:hypothetical protein